MPAQSLARDEAGNIWEVDAQGNPVRLHQPAQGGPNVVMPAAPPKPEFVPGNPNLVYTPGQGVSNLPGVPAPKPPAPDFVPGTPGFAMGPDGKAHPIEGLPGAGIQMDPSQRAKAIQQYNYAQQLDATADQLNQLYLKGPGKTSGIEGLKDYFPTPDNRNFDTAANKSRGIVGQTLGFTGGQLNTPQEAEKAVGPYIPASGDFDSQILQKIQSMRDLAANGRQNAIQTLGGIPDANGNVHPVQQEQNAPPPATSAQPNSGMGLAGGSKTHAKIDPVLRATGQRLGAMVSSGVPDDKVIQFLQQSGVDPNSTNIRNILDWRAGKQIPGAPSFKDWQRKNPGAGVPIGPAFYTKQVPMSDARHLFNQAAATDLGGDLTAGIAASANAITGGRLDNMVGDPEVARTGMDLLRANHPLSSFAGDVAGQATLEGLAGTIPGVRGLMATRMGRRGADALYGAYSGSGESDGNAGVGALEGAVSGLGMGMFGRGIQSGAGKAMTGVRNAGLKYLDKAGVPLTIGRIARGASDFNPMNPATAGDVASRGIAGIEDRLMGLPGLDAAIGTARQRGDQGFNQAMFREIAPGVTGTGAAGLTSAKAAEQAAYAKLAPVRLSVDEPFAQALDATSQAAQDLTHHAGDVQTVINDIRSQINDGGMTGKGYQTAMQAIRKTRATLNDDVGGKAASTLDNLEQEVMALGNRQGGQIAQDLAEANAIHGRRQIVKQALKGPIAQGADEIASPKAFNQASIRNTERFGGLDRALSPDRPFYDLTSAGMKAMPNLTPDSGTAGRLLMYPLIAGAGGAGIGAVTDSDRAGGGERGASIGTGLGLLALGAGAGPYSRTGQKALQRVLLGERPEAVQRIGDYLLKANPRFAGMFGSGIGRDYFFQPESPQY